MKNFNNFNGLHVHFIGIGGISMSGLASIVIARGGRVSGSDISLSQETDKLKSLGAIIYAEHNASNITIDINLVVYTAAISSNNPELICARKLGIKVMERAEFLGLIASTYKHVIAVAGTHGKTTTTALVSEILYLAGFNPTIHIGGESIGLKGNTIIGDSDLFVVEACEYKESFRYLKPYIGIITNIEADHLDYYKDYEDVRAAFLRFASRSEKLISLNSDNLSHSEHQTIFGDWEIKHLEFVGDGYNFNVFFKKDFLGSFRINMLGEHNVTNALFAIATAYSLGVDINIIDKALSGFMGVERRYETIHRFKNGCSVIIDYAHHPTELNASIMGLEGVYKRTLYVFQPHTYSRTLRLFGEFIGVLEKLENLIIYETYAAREAVLDGGSAIDLYNALMSKDKANKNIQYFNSVEDLMRLIECKSREFDCILVLGAGSLAEILRRKYVNA